MIGCTGTYELLTNQSKGWSSQNWRCRVPRAAQDRRAIEVLDVTELILIAIFQVGYGTKVDGHASQRIGIPNGYVYAAWNSCTGVYLIGETRFRIECGIRVAADRSLPCGRGAVASNAIGCRRCSRARFEDAGAILIVIYGPILEALWWNGG